MPGKLSGDFPLLDRTCCFAHSTSQMYSDFQKCMAWAACFAHKKSLMAHFCGFIENLEKKKLFTEPRMPKSYPYSPNTHLAPDMISELQQEVAQKVCNHIISQLWAKAIVKYNTLNHYLFQSNWVCCTIYKKFSLKIHCSLFWREFIWGKAKFWLWWWLGLQYFYTIGIFPIKRHIFFHVCLLDTVHM